jgi:hypothetical protein
MVAWEKLKTYARQGETFVEGVEEHVAVLLARHMDAERRAQLETDVAAIDAPAPTPAPDRVNGTVVASSGDGAGAAAQPAVALDQGTDANGSLTA